MHRLKPTIQQYAWGKTGTHSEVANLYKAGDEGDFKIEPNQSYAELWMGTHPKGPSTLASTGESLADWLAANKDVLGEKLSAKLCGGGGGEEAVNLPLLFKVLSVSKALSIQVHPTKEQAAALHANDPTNYPDDNHKPEISIALSPFEMLCGFKPIKQVCTNIAETPELFELIGGEPFEALSACLKEQEAGGQPDSRAALRQCFNSLVNQPDVLVQRNVETLTARCALRIKSQQERGNQSMDAAYVLAELLIRLNYHYPGDIGVFMPLLLNHFVLDPGEACFLAPNEPHAYLFGDCIECMACSDNTIRAGLTPKYKDVNTLCDSLTYRMAPPDDNKFEPAVHPNDANVLVYAPPVPEFVVHRITVEASGFYDLLALPTCSLLVVVSGSANAAVPHSQTVARGQVYFLAAGQMPIRLAVEQTPFVAFRAFTDDNMVGML